MYYYDYMGFFGFEFMTIFVLIFIGAIIWMMLETQRPKKRNVNPITIAERRYAKGEITKNEFEEIKKELKRD